jgi:hypothetical protein
MGTGNNTVLVIACCLLCAKARGKAGVLEGNEQRPEDIGGARRREGGGVFFALSCGWSLWLIRIMVGLQIPLGNKVGLVGSGGSSRRCFCTCCMACQTLLHS